MRDASGGMGGAPAGKRDRDTMAPGRKVNSQAHGAATCPTERPGAPGGFAKPRSRFQIHRSRNSLGGQSPSRRSTDDTTKDRSRAEQGGLRGGMADVRRALARP